MSLLSHVHTNIGTINPDQMFQCCVSTLFSKTSQSRLQFINTSLRKHVNTKTTAADDRNVQVFGDKPKLGNLGNLKSWTVWVDHQSYSDPMGAMNVCANVEGNPCNIWQNIPPDNTAIPSAMWLVWLKIVANMWPQQSKWPKSSWYVPKVLFFKNVIPPMMFPC